MWRFGVVMLRIGAGKQTWEFLLSGSLAGLGLRSRTEVRPVSCHRSKNEKGWVLHEGRCMSLTVKGCFSHLDKQSSPWKMGQ